jgi:hypothetical protein
MSLVYAHQPENRTDYLKESLDRDFGEAALDTFIGFTSPVIWHTAAAT